MTEHTPAILGWPFLVARGRRRGYRVLLVPDVLAEAGQAGVLADGLRGDTVPGSPPRVETLSVPDVGRLSCAYRTERLGGRDPAGDRVVDSTSPVLDEHGRPLEILYGIVCSTDDDLDPDADDLDLARHEALSAYGRFLADEAGFPGERSRAFPLRSRLRPVRLPPPEFATADGQHDSARRAVPASSAQTRSGVRLPSGLVAAGVAVAAMMISVAVILALRSQEARVVDVRLRPPDDVVLECGREDDLTVTGELTTDGPAEVSFHGEDSSDGWESPRQTTGTAAAGSHRVELTRPLLVLVGETRAGSLSLVVDEPNSIIGAVDYVVTCSEPD